MILILGGTGDARRFGRLASEADIDGTISIVGATSEPAPQSMPVRVGPFGGLDKLRAYLRDQSIDAVVDMTHPFARQMTGRAVEACSAESIPFLRFERPVWEPIPGAKWQSAPSPARVVDYVPRDAKVFVAAGPNSALEFGLAGYNVLCRRAEPTDAMPPDGWRWIVARPPYDLDAERELLHREKIDLMICKNSGGDAGRTKLDAAAQLGIPIVMLERPSLPDGVKTAQTLWGALEWVKATLR